MPIRTVRYTFGWLLLLAHFATIGVYAIVGPLFNFDFLDVLVGIVTVAPVAGAYVTIFVRYVSTHSNPPASEHGATIGTAPFLVQFFILLLFSLTLVGGTLFLLVDGTMSSESAKAFSGAVDTVFGVYIGTIFQKLFPDDLFKQD